MLNPSTVGNASLDATDYADINDRLDADATQLELEATYGNPADTERLSKAAKLLRRAILQLQPLAEADADADTAIEAPEPATSCRCCRYPINPADRLCPRCCVDLDSLEPEGYTPDEARRINSFEMWGHQ